MRSLSLVLLVLVSWCSVCVSVDYYPVIVDPSKGQYDVLYYPNDRLKVSGIISIGPATFNTIASVATDLYLRSICIDVRNLVASQSLWYDAGTKTLRGGPLITPQVGRILEYAIPNTTINTGNYIVIGNIIWPGTDSVGIPKSLLVITWITIPQTSYNVRLFDYTNNSTIIEVTASNTTKKVKYFTGITNCSEAPAVWEIQVKGSLDGGSINFESLNINF